MRRKNKAWHYALQSDPERNPQFRRDWSETVAAGRKPGEPPQTAPRRPDQTKKTSS